MTAVDADLSPDADLSLSNICNYPGTYVW